MKKILLPMLASLLLFKGTAVFPAPTFTLDSRSESNTTELTVRTDDNAIFQFEDFNRDGILDKVTEWSGDLELAASYQGGNVTQSQQDLFASVVKGYLIKETNRFLSILQKNPKNLSFYTPFGTGKNNGRFILDFNGVQFKLYEGENGKLSFYEGVPSRVWGEKSTDLVNVTNVGEGSTEYPVLKNLETKLEAEIVKTVDDQFKDIKAYFPADASK